MTVRTALSPDEARWACYREELPEIVQSRFPAPRSEMTTAVPTSVQDAGLQELRDVAALMVAHRREEHALITAAVAKANERLVDPHDIADVFTEAGITMCDLRAALDGP